MSLLFLVQIMCQYKLQANWLGT